MLMKTAGRVPEEFASVAMPAGAYAVAWIRGKDDPALYAMHEACVQASEAEDMRPALFSNGETP